jgi:hypothetical protein
MAKARKARGGVARWSFTLLLLGAVAGCQAPVLTVDDAVVMRGEKTRLAACLEREPVLWLSKDVENAPVRFYIDEQQVGETKTDEDGVAAVEQRLDPDLQRFEVRAWAGFQELQATGRVFAWDRERVIIAVDIDHTIAKTDYEELLAQRGKDESDPVKHSVQALNALARDFHIVYLTSRPRFLIDKTRAWLREKGFPTGPVITSVRIRDLVRPKEFKEERLHTLRKAWPTLLIGIGNQPSDAEAYGASGMLSLMLPGKNGGDFAPHAIVFRDWKGLVRFCEANHETLASAAQLKEAIKGERLLSQPVTPYKKR